MDAVDEPDWLSATEMRAWRGWLEATRRIAAAIDADLHADADLSSDDYEVLVRLSDCPDRRLRMTELAEQVQNSPSRLSQRIDRLTRRGLVRRERCADDRRGLYAVLTARGGNVLAAAAPDHLVSVRRHLFDHLDDHEVAILAELLPRLATGGCAEAGTQ